MAESYADRLQAQQNFQRYREAKPKRDKIAEILLELRTGFILQYFSIHVRDEDLDDNLKTIGTIQQILDESAGSSILIHEVREFVLSRFANAIVQEGDLGGLLRETEGHGNFVADQMGATKKMVNLDVFKGQSVKNVLDEIEGAINRLIDY